MQTYEDIVEKAEKTLKEKGSEMATLNIVIQILDALATLIPKLIELEQSIEQTGIVQKDIRNLRVIVEVVKEYMQDILFKLAGKK